MICRNFVRRNIPSSYVQSRFYQTARPKVEGTTVSTLKIDLKQLRSKINEQSQKSQQSTASPAKETHDLLSLPPSLRQVRKIMDIHKSNVVLTQMGSFYELYFEHATEYAPKLNISLTSKKYSYGNVPFAGFPLAQLGRHLKVLVNQFGYSVTIVDQFQNSSPIDTDPNRFSRKVTRIVTPGTFIDDAFENFKDNTYLLNLEFPSKCTEKLADGDLKIGLCWCDLSTGEIFVQEVLLKDLVAAITRIKPKEIILNKEFSEQNLESGKWYPELVELKKYFVKFQTLPAHYHTVDTFYNLFFNGTSSFVKKQLDHKMKSFSQKELASMRNILEYVNDHLPDCSVNFQIPERQLTTSIMQIDSRTNAALELHNTMISGGRKGSLLSSIRRTCTPSGTRLLTQWISAPSLNLSEIKERQSLVSYFKANSKVTDSLISKLKDVTDISRVLQKMSFGRGTPLELLRLAQSMVTAEEIHDLIANAIPKAKKSQQSMLTRICDGLQFDKAIVDDIMKALNEDNILQSDKAALEASEGSPDENIDVVKKVAEDLPKSQTFTGIINPNYSTSLRKLYSEYETLSEKKAKLEESYSKFFTEKFGVRKVSIKERQDHTFAIHISGASATLEKLSEWVKLGNSFEGSSFSPIQQSSQTRWLSSKTLTNIISEMELCSLNIKREEDNILTSLKLRLVTQCHEIRTVNSGISYLDVISSFAILAAERNLVCPKVDKSYKLDIVKGRHLMVEEGITSKSLERFVSNSCNLDNGSIWVITGPNMGGKSTFLRQNAIIVILAQIGCYVPCESAHIGLVDKIFSRVGSADDLYNEMSTFMVEMVETSFILRGASERSLAILDEIGRGTSGKEGVSIAYATLNYMAGHNRCRALFATHFGEDIHKIIKDKNDAVLQNKVSFYQSKVVDVDQDNFFYDYRMVPGISQRSDAIKVAKLAGFPESALQQAESILGYK
ncbi:mismatch repair ATPase [Maudiozyma humilis]|uniref:Mismatch repair ATPase n=1 Tax=Maudiozyma humilis TaxID=51915 RepID=A0AAV5RSC9_MAUHU|nr:mismatch repair ATPase [Kazachstania humilis]